MWSGFERAVVPISVSIITADQAAKILEKSEGHFGDFKSKAISRLASLRRSLRSRMQTVANCMLVSTSRVIAFIGMALPKPKMRTDTSRHSKSFSRSVRAFATRSWSARVAQG